MARALQWLVPAAFGVDAFFLLNAYIQAEIIIYNQWAFILTIGLLIAMWGLSLAILVTALIATWQRHEFRWLITFVVLGGISIAGTALLLLQLAYQSTSLAIYELVFDLLRFFLGGDNFSAFRLFLPVLFVAYLLPLSVAALRYRREQAVEVVG